MTDVHTEHCCIVHGCKYNNDHCTVIVNGPTVQSYPCEDCTRESLIIATEHNVEHAKPGNRVEVLSGDYEGIWLRIEDADPPYIYKKWVNIDTGRVCPHWSWLFTT